MPDTFQILARFLERYGDDVEGRAVTEPAVEAREKLQRLARGTLPETEQAELFTLLSRNPDWIGWLAREVKSLRPAGPRITRHAE
jgi:hypothetical protein